MRGCASTHQVSCVCLGVGPGCGACEWGLGVRPGCEAWVWVLGGGPGSGPRGGAQTSAQTPSLECPVNVCFLQSWASHTWGFGPDGYHTGWVSFGECSENVYAVREQTVLFLPVYTCLLCCTGEDRQHETDRHGGRIHRAFFLTSGGTLNISPLNIMSTELF